MNLADQSGLPERFWAKVRIEDAGYETLCFMWTGYILYTGYGRFGWNGKIRYAHRVAYEVMVAPIPEGLVLDHLCRNRACVNVAHLEPVTNRVNVLRGLTVVAANASKTHCVRGHEFTPENTYTNPSRHGRHCRICIREHRAARSVRERAERAQQPKRVLTHCRNGHAFDESNTYVNPRGNRLCRICLRAASLRHKQKKRANRTDIGVPPGVSGRQRLNFLSLTDEQKAIYRLHFDVHGRIAAHCYRIAAGETDL